MKTIPEYMKLSDCPVCKHKDNKAVIRDKGWIWYKCPCGTDYKKNVNYVIVG
jgi:ribosomal protein L37AE/L43A